MKKLFIALGMLLILAIAGWFSGIGFSRIHAPARYHAPDGIVLPEKGKVGEKIPVSLKIGCSRADNITSVTVTPGAGSIAGKSAIVRRTHWLNAENRVSFTLLPLRSGKIPEGRIEWSFADGKKSSVVLPGFDAEPGGSIETQEIQLAGALPQKAARWWLWGIAGAALLLAAGVAGFFLRRRRRQREKSFYERILEKIAGVKRNSATPEEGIARLTDLVRSYLDHRFACAVESASTWEFFRILEQKDSPLPAEIHPFLRDFLRYADIVKFARGDADWAHLTEAAERAADLVRSTQPQEKEAKRV